MNHADFPDLIARVRAGDDAAAETLVRAFEPELRRYVRTRFGSRLPNLQDPTDAVQSAFLRLWLGLRAGLWNLDKPDDLVGVLIVIARHRVLDHAAVDGAAKRGGGWKRARPASSTASLDAAATRPSASPTGTC